MQGDQPASCVVTVLLLEGPRPSMVNAAMMYVYMVKGSRLVRSREVLVAFRTATMSSVSASCNITL